MFKAMKLVFLCIAACVVQTTLVRYIRIAGVAPDMLIVLLVLLTSYTGVYGGFCSGSLIAMFYDASIGYVLAINLVGYTFIGWAAPVMRTMLYKTFRKLKHKSVLVMMLICFILTLMREVLYAGYLFLIGAELGMMTMVRALMCACYSAALIIPCTYIVRKVMSWKIGVRRKQEEFIEEKTVV